MIVTYWKRAAGQEAELTPEELSAWTARNGRKSGVGPDGRCFIFSDADVQKAILQAARDAEEAKWAADAPLRERERIIGELGRLDPKCIRQIDDLLALLIAKGVFLLSELPAAFQARYAERKALREKLR